MLCCLHGKLAVVKFFVGSSTARDPRRIILGIRFFSISCVCTRPGQVCRKLTPGFVTARESVKKVFSNVGWLILFKTEYFSLSPRSPSSRLSSPRPGAKTEMTRAQGDAESNGRPVESTFENSTALISYVDSFEGLFITRRCE